MVKGIEYRAPLPEPPEQPLHEVDEFTAFILRAAGVSDESLVIVPTLPKMKVEPTKAITSPSEELKTEKIFKALGIPYFPPIRTEPKKKRNKKK